MDHNNIVCKDLVDSYDSSDRYFERGGAQDGRLNIPTHFCIGEEKTNVFLQHLLFRVSLEISVVRS
jgi:hypothetical protein